MFLSIAATCAFVALNVAAPKVLGDATDVIVNGVVQGAFDESRLASLLLAVAWIYVGASLFSWLQGTLTATAVQRVGYGLRAAVEAKLHRLPFSHFEVQRRGEVLSRATHDVDIIAQALNQLLNQLILSVLMLSGALAMMVWLSPVLALIALVSVPVSTAITVLVARKSQAQFAAQGSSTGELHAQLEDFFTGHEVIKAFGRQGEAATEFHARNDELTRAGARAQFLSGAVQPLMVLVSNLNYIAVAVVGALQVTTGTLTIGGVQAFIQFSRLFSQPMGQIGSMLTLVQPCLVSAGRVFDLLDAAEIPAEPAADARSTAAAEAPRDMSPSTPPARPAPARRASARVAFEHVTFSYGQGKPVVQDLSFVVEPGQLVAIVGPTGAGKTTVVNLLMRFYDVGSGRITVDGVDISQVPLDELRGMFGTVLQDAWIFTGTIRENIEYGRPGATDDEIIAAAVPSLVDQFVRSLPAGYGTLLGNDGASLSHGQQQLIGIARAQLAARNILVLDEATSSVDSRTEVQIREAMQRLREGRTSFVIAHRLATVRDADLILVMDHGQIVEHGTHRQLMAGGGFYASLHQAQFAGREQTPGAAEPKQ
ncbi:MULTISPECIES: ABC transporter ATP-binding protein [Arthrobacter]|uniref:Fatty acid ABC transporter ATP-binding/permease protein n=1 Tax=Arthrobacter oryzae TaxID=409290 RepID=A0A3N0C787_9MICC|nr:MULTISPECIES: ABC transporter ATP-binding protein [Arthrobacter]QYF91329.1 ABC transporter ATP-binding protein/permease [Arthrobacter sp. PAMC25284]RNL58398.1 ABC transporter ATP-binding protein [Arthrobacter oryzae]